VTGRLAWGLAAAATYVLFSLGQLGPQGLPFRPLFDGLAPPRPYRWVDPPAEFAEENQPPLSGTIELVLGREGSKAASLITRDGQAQVTFGDRAFEATGEERAVRVQIRPVDPDQFGPPPAGLPFNGNAYEVEAEYLPSGRPAPVAREISMALRYPTHATVILRWSGDGWVRLETGQISANLTVFAATTELGVYVPAGRPQPATRGFPWATLGYLSVGAAALAVALGVRTRRRGAAARQRQQARARAAAREAAARTRSRARKKRRGR
jgi:hypothetical protein